MPSHVEGGKGREYAGGSFRTGVLVADLDKVRLLESFDIQAVRQLANGMFGLGGAVGVRGVGGNQSRHFHNLLQKIFVAQEFDFGIEFFFSNVGTGEIHGAGGLGRDDGVKAAPPQQNLEVGFIARREDDEEHRRQQYERKRGGYESRTPEQRGRKLAGRGGKQGCASFRSIPRTWIVQQSRSHPAGFMGTRQILKTQSVNAAAPFR